MVSARDLAKGVAPVEAIVARSPIDRVLRLQLATPNIENKIRWHVRKNAWEVKAISMLLPENFQKMFEVDGALRGEDFFKMKVVQYRLAIAEWNRCDHSTRRRITAPLVIFNAGVRVFCSMPHQAEPSPTPQAMVVASDGTATASQPSVPSASM